MLLIGIGTHCTQTLVTQDSFKVVESDSSGAKTEQTVNMALYLVLRNVGRLVAGARNQWAIDPTHFTASFSRAHNPFFYPRYDLRWHALLRGTQDK